MRIEDDAGLSDLIVSAAEKRLCTDFGFTEGPIWVSSDRCLLFSDIPGNRMHRWRPGASGAEVYREPSGHANGLTLDREGNVLACEHSGRRVSGAAYGGPPATLADRHRGKRLNSPNDIVVHSSGAVYFTDPPAGLRPPPPGRLPFGDPRAKQELDFQGVYRLGPNGALSVLIDDLPWPNGLAFSPDESLFYVANSRPQRIVQRYRVLPDGSLSASEVFVDMRDDARPGVPDGIKVDEEGRVWISGAGGIWVVTAEGRRLGVLVPAEHPANLAFGGAEFSTLFLTAQSSVYGVETRVRGIAPGSRP